MRKDKEQRMFADVFSHSEVRNGDKTELVIEGYASVFGERALIGAEDYGFYEVIDRDAFNGADLSDVPLKYNHNDSVPILARTRNGSLSLNVDDRGLRIRAVLLDTQDARDMYKRVEAGLIDKMSFAFTVKESEWSDSTTPITRTIKRFEKIWDVSVVDVPAFDGTSVSARSLDLLDSELRLLESKRAGRRNWSVAGLVARYGK